MGSKVVLLHGFTQTSASWPTEIVDVLRGRGHDVVAVDAPGHGSASDVRAGLVETANALASAHGQADWVGYSMGGRLALHVAVHHPHVVRRLVLIGATPGIEDHEERAARRAADSELAASIQRDGVDAFLVRWLANPLFASLPPDRTAIESRRSNTAEGLAASLRLLGTGAQQPLWDHLPHLSAPALLLVGELDVKFAAIAARMADAWGGPAFLDVVEHAGHAVHLEQPMAVAARIAEFLDGDDHATTSATTSSAP